MTGLESLMNGGHQEDMTENIYSKKRRVLDNKEARFYRGHYISEDEETKEFSVYSVDGKLIKDGFKELNDALWFLVKRELTQKKDEYFRKLYLLSEEKIREVYQRCVMTYIENKDSMEPEQEKTHKDLLDTLLLLTNRKSLGKEY